MAQDIKLYFEKHGRGDGYPLIMLHGNGEDCTYFSEQVKEFKNDRTIYLVDTRGHGKSARGTAPFTIRQFADDLKDFMDEQNIEKADILGFSDGGNILLIFAMKYPEKVNRIIVNGANLDTTGIVPKLQNRIEEKYHQYCQDADKDPKAKAKMEMFNLMVNDPNIPYEDLKSITCDTLVCAGSEDIVLEEHTYKIANGIPGSKLVIVPGTHFVAKENPSDFNKMMREFLG